MSKVLTGASSVQPGLELQYIPALHDLWGFHLGLSPAPVPSFWTHGVSLFTRAAVFDKVCVGRTTDFCIPYTLQLPPLGSLPTNSSHSRKPLLQSPIPQPSKTATPGLVSTFRHMDRNVIQTESLCKPGLPCFSYFMDHITELLGVPFLAAAAS